MISFDTNILLCALNRKDVARRRIIDARLALTLRHHGVTDFLTRNVRDFEGLGFARVTNPIDPAAP